VALLEKRGFLYNHSGDFPQVILIIPSHVPNRKAILPSVGSCPEYPNSENNLLLGSPEGFKVNLTSCFLPVAKSRQDSLNIPA
jgi:hypothetical protein